MEAINKLLDCVREVCEYQHDSELADRLKVSRQLVSQWRKGANPVSDERVAELAKLCGGDAGEWLVKVRGEQARGDAAKAWRNLAKRLGAVAALVIVTALPRLAQAQEMASAEPDTRHYAKWLAKLRGWFVPCSFVTA